MIEQRHLPEQLPGAEARHHLVADYHFRLAVEDGVDAIAEVALAEHFLPGFEVLAQQELLIGEPELHQLGREEEIEGPGRGHLELAAEPRQLLEIDGAPEEPRQRPGDLQAEHVRDRGVPAERAHLAEALEVEGAPRATTDRGEQVVREHHRLPRRVLRRRGRDAAVERRHLRAVPERPHAVEPLDGQFRGDQDPPALVLRQVQPLDQGMREGGHGGDQRARRDGASVREHGFLAGRRGEPGLEEQLDAALAQDALREAAQLLRHLGEDPVLGVDQHDADLARVDLRIVRRHAPHEVVQLRHHFDAGEAAAGDDERQQLSPQLLVVALDRRLLERADHVVA